MEAGPSSVRAQAVQICFRLKGKESSMKSKPGCPGCGWNETRADFFVCIRRLERIDCFIDGLSYHELQSDCDEREIEVRIAAGG